MQRSASPLDPAVERCLYLGQRFAIDFNRLDPENRISTGDPSLNESYPTYGQPVVAVADARVVVAVDRFPDQTPNAPGPVTLESVDGNHVILALGNGRYAFYAHLKPGFLVVWVCREEEARAALAEGRDPRGMPWPAEDAQIADPVSHP